MEYIHHKVKDSAPLLVLLHGTGGNERDLLGVAENIAPDSNILSLRGTVNEGGSLRFFKRKAEGVYDLEDMEARGKALLDFIEKFIAEEGYKPTQLVFLGFSNGANMIINLLLQEASNYKYAMLFAPMYPVDLSQNTKDLSQLKVFLSMGEYDLIARKHHSQEVIDIFKTRRAQVTEYWVQTHHLPPQAQAAAKEWLEVNYQE